MTRSYLNMWSIVIISIILGGCSSKPKNAPESNEEKTKVLHDIMLADLNGKRIDMSTFKNKTVFINFWATWCGPCIKEMPSIERAKTVLKDTNIEFLLASNEMANQILSFAAKRTLDLRYVQVQNLEELGIATLPTTYIFSPTGELAFSEAGYRAWDKNENIELLTQIANKHE